MAMAEISWEEATLRILREVKEPIHYSDIAEIILSRGLKTTIGKTPQFTVAGEISKLRSSGKENIIKTAPGVYWLPEETFAPAEDTLGDVEEELDATDATQNLAVAAYGLHWERSKVDWRAGRILGYDPGFDIDADPERAINFADQQGVYLLHNWQSVVYVGRTAAEKNGLFQRLHQHHRKQVWSAKWERFSWFGIRRVSETGGMIDGPAQASKEVVSALMEAVLIETLGPSFNKTQGNYMGTLYHQTTDPNVAKTQAQNLLRGLTGP